jgi:5-methylcytosine-specific restriction endonuclease McrA
MRYGYHPSDRRGHTQTQKEAGFYKTPAWRRIRKQALTRDHYLCQLRTSKKCSGFATEVHHIVPLETDPARRLDLENLVSCCWWCHEETKPKKKPAAVYGARVIRITDGSEIESEFDSENDSLG